MPGKLHNRKYLKEIRKELRNHTTDSEARLWSCLKKKQLHGRKFRRQHSIGNYVVDFFCYPEKLIVEIDGSSHDNYSNDDYELKRDEFLSNCGFNILRFEAIDIRNNLDAVLEQIKDNFVYDQD